MNTETHYELILHSVRHAENESRRREHSEDAVGRLAYEMAGTVGCRPFLCKAVHDAVVIDLKEHIAYEPSEYVGDGSVGRELICNYDLVNDTALIVIKVTKYTKEV